LGLFSGKFAALVVKNFMQMPTYQVGRTPPTRRPPATRRSLAANGRRMVECWHVD
jgi:hypothetical protein